MGKDVGRMWEQIPSMHTQPPNTTTQPPTRQDASRRGVGCDVGREGSGRTDENLGEVGVEEEGEVGAAGPVPGLRLHEGALQDLPQAEGLQLLQRDGRDWAVGGTREMERGEGRASGTLPAPSRGTRRSNGIIIVVAFGSCGLELWWPRGIPLPSLTHGRGPARTLAGGCGPPVG